MARQVVEYDYIPRLQRRQENLRYVSQKERTIQRAIDDHRRGELIVSQGRNKRGRLPMTVWCIIDHSFPTTGSTIHPNEIGLQARFINEDQLFSRQTRTLGTPVGTPQLHVGALLLTGVQDFF